MDVIINLADRFRDAEEKTNQWMAERMASE